MKSGFKHRITRLLFSMAAGLGAASVMSGPLDWAGAPKPQRGKPLAFGRNGQAEDAYGVAYEREANGTIRRLARRVSVRSRGARKAIWSGKVAA
jgi:hypothetical protein